MIGQSNEITIVGIGFLGSILTHLNTPNAIIVDQNDSIYYAHLQNN